MTKLFVKAMITLLFLVYPSVTLDTHYRDEGGRIYPRHYWFAVGVGSLIMMLYTLILRETDQNNLAGAFLSLTLVMNMFIIPMQAILRGIDLITEPRP